MARRAGKGGKVMLATTGSGAPVTLIHIKDWSWNGTTDKIDVTSMDDANKTNLRGMADVSGSLSGFWDDTNDTAYAASQSADPVTMALYPNEDAVGKWGSGLVNIDFSIQGSVGGAVEFTANWTAAGDWTWAL